MAAPSVPSAPFPRYSSMRQSCLAGYYEEPQVYSGMTFELRRIPKVTSRVVKREGRTWELWSPNSTQTPFLPGCRGQIPSMPLEPQARRYDGHFGRFDCLYSPHYSGGDIPHWPFMRRPHLVKTDDFAYPAYEPLMRQWEVNPQNPSKGRFRPAYLEVLSALRRELDACMNAVRDRLRKESTTWAERPQYADATRVGELLNTEFWWEAVDKGMNVQRGLREKEGWLTMMHARMSLDHLKLEQLRELEFPLADEHYMGVWVNGLLEGPVLRYLYTGIPSFIVHSYASEDRTRADTYPDTRTCSDFVVGTDLVPSLRESPYQQLARKDAERLDALEQANIGTFRPVTIEPEHEQHSSSLYLEQLGIQTASQREEEGKRFQLDGWRKKREETALPTIQAPLLTFPDESPAKENRYAHQELEKRVIDASRVEWIVPPPVHEKREEDWVKFEMDLLGSGRDAFVYRGSKRKMQADVEWFDRSKGRRIWLSDYHVPPGVVNSKVFGAPVPHLPFVVMNGEQETMKLPSHWMYPSRHPHPSDVGRRADPPRPEELPFKDG
ncbi:hypothetical protein R3P38DRAFT_2562270, partial [Favolaschia claudopus]